MMQQSTPLPHHPPSHQPPQSQPPQQQQQAHHRQQQQRKTTPLAAANTVAHAPPPPLPAQAPSSPRALAGFNTRSPGIGSGAVGTPASIAHSCDIVIEALDRQAQLQFQSQGDAPSSATPAAAAQNPSPEAIAAATEASSFRDEVQTLRKYLSLIERVRRAKTTRLEFEEDFWQTVLVVLRRCCDCLARLCGMLADFEAELLLRSKVSKEVKAKAEGRGWVELAMEEMRGEVGLHKDVLKMSLQVVHLVDQWKSRTSQDGTYFHWHDLSGSVQALKERLTKERHRKRVSNLPTTNSDYTMAAPISAEEAALLRDIDYVIVHAESVLAITTNSVYEDTQSPFLLSSTEANDFVDNKLMPQPLRIPTPTKSGRTSLNSNVDPAEKERRTPSPQLLASKEPPKGLGVDVGDGVMEGSSPVKGKGLAPLAVKERGPSSPARSPMATSPMSLGVKEQQANVPSSPMRSPMSLGVKEQQVTVPSSPMRSPMSAIPSPMAYMRTDEPSIKSPMRVIPRPVSARSRGEVEPQSPLRSQMTAGLAPGGVKERSRSPSPLRDLPPEKLEKAQHAPASDSQRTSINVKHQGTSDSDFDSMSDPEPEQDEGLPAEVYTHIIATLQQDVQRLVNEGDYQKAEACHRKAIKHLMDREKILGIPFDNRTEMDEILVGIYMNQNELDRAKKMLNRLLMQEREETARKWTLYHALASVYHRQERLPEAEKYSKRAFRGREKMLPKGHPSIHESVTLLIHIYKQKGETETAEALSKIYAPRPPPPQTPISPGIPKHFSQYSDVHELESPNTPQLSQFPEVPSYSPLSKIPSPAPTQPQPSPFAPPNLSTPTLSTHRESRDSGHRPAPDMVPWGPDAWVDPTSIDAPTKSGETPLIAAISAADDEMVSLILARGASVEARCVEEITPLMHAISHGYETIAEVLLNAGAHVDTPTSGWTPLHKAASLNNLAMVRRLLSHAANIEARSPAKFVPRKSALEIIRARENALDSDDDADADDANVGWTALLRSAANGDEAMVRLLLDRGADIEARSPSNGTPLLCAAEGKHIVIMDMLLLRGASVSAYDEFGWQALHRGLVTRGGERVAQLLLDHGAEINARCTYRKAPLHYAIEKGDEGMVCFLLNAGADIEARDMAEQTPLHTAIECRHEGLVRTLLENGADHHAKNRAGRDALVAAQKTLRRSPEIVAVLAKHEKARRGTRGEFGRRNVSVVSGVGSFRGASSGSGNGPPNGPPGGMLLGPGGGGPSSSGGGAQRKVSVSSTSTGATGMTGTTGTTRTSSKSSVGSWLSIRSRKGKDKPGAGLAVARE